MKREEAIRYVFEKHGPEALYVINNGYLSRAVYSLYEKAKNIFYMQGSMGLAPSIGLGIAENTSKNVIVLTGDGSLLMHLGITHTIRDENLKNLYVYVFDNNCYESVGGQPVPSLEKNYPGITEIIKIDTEKECPGRVNLSFSEIKNNFSVEIKK